MKDIKKLMITLVALLAVTTGAWAETWDSGDCTVTLSGVVITVSGTGAMADYEEYQTPWYDYHDEIKNIVIESGVTSIGRYAFDNCYNLESVSIPASVTSIGARAFKKCGSDVDALTVSFAEGSTPLTIRDDVFSGTNLKSIDIPNRVTSIGGYAFYGIKDLESVSIPANVTIIEDGAFSNCSKLAKVYIYATSLTTYGPYAFDGNAAGRKIYVLSDALDTYKAGWPAYAADIEAIPGSASASSGPEVAWTAASKTGTFKMPGGNVTLEPEYYPQAALTAQPTAINDVPATTDGAIVKAGTVANIGETTNAQGTVMYYVSKTALDDAALLALDADQWTADVPTAKSLAQGQAYVYYYVRGNDSDNDDENFSDGDILAANALTVTIAAEPTYAVTFAEGVNPEPPAVPEWTASPNTGVTKGQTVTVTYTGSKKVIGVKAEKKAAAASTPSLNITNPVVGQVIGSDGKNYAAANVPSGVDKVAMIAYVSGSNGLAIALADEGEMNWATAKSTCEAKTPAFTNGTWKLPTQDEWKQMFSANGGDEGSYNGLNTAITTAGGTAFPDDGTVYYWSSSEYDSDFANSIEFYYGSAYPSKAWKTSGRLVRACLAF